MSENFEKLKLLIHQTVIERLNGIKRQNKNKNKKGNDENINKSDNII